MLVIYGVLGVKNAGTGWDGTRAMGWGLGGLQGSTGIVFWPGPGPG